jgi:plastocyanin
MRRILVIAAFLFSPCFLVAQTSPGLKQIEGCLASERGQYVLVQDNPRRMIALRGNERTLGNHVGQLVVLKGHPSGGQTESNLKEYWVNETISKASRCPEPISGALPAIPVGGESGGHEVSTATTTSSTVMKTTPGYETESGYRQAPGSTTFPRTAPPPSAGPPAAPPDMAMPNQTADTAELGAEAAARAEYGPHTLGVGNNMPQQNGPEGDQANSGPLDKQSQIGYQSQLQNPPTAPEAGYPNPANVDADTLQFASTAHGSSPFPVTVGQAHPSATVEISKHKLTPLQVTIQPGQTVVWTNTSGTIVSKLEDATGKFTAQQLKPGASFAHMFDRPGRYLYSLQVGDQTLAGAVVVQK